MQIRCASCSRAVTVAQTGLLPEQCPHCRNAPVPERIDKWRIVRLIAAGGMGEVYAAAHVDLGTEVAIKLLPPLPGSNASSLRERFLREARLTASVDHPGVVRVFDCASAGDRLYLLLELVPGRSLRSLLKQGPVPVAEAARIAAETADVLAAAHRKGVVHRDVKPDNVLLQPDGRVRVLDFGIARALQDQEPITNTGEILGTPEYMAPEQLLDTATEIDARTDVHALGLLLYELLTGRSPFQGGTMFQALKLVESLQPPPPSKLRPEVPAALDAVVQQALEKDRERRFTDASAFATAVRAAVPASGTGWSLVPVAPASVSRSKTTGFVAAGAVFVLVVLMIALRSPRETVLPAPEARRLGAQQEIERLVAHDGTGSVRLQQAVRDLDDAAAGEQVALRGRARMLLGQFTAAVQDFDRAGGVGVQAAAAWHAVHSLLPAVAGMPPWLRCVDRQRRDRLLGKQANAPDGPPERAGDEVLVAARKLANGEAAAAFSALANKAPLPADASLLRLLAGQLGCADRARFTALLATAPTPNSAALRLLVDGSTGKVTPAELLRNLATTCDPGSADRWVLELLATFCECRDGNGRVERLQAAAELGWLCGAGELATVWFAGLRVHLAALRPGPHRLDAAEAQRLYRLCSQVNVEDCPAVVPLRALLQLAASGPEAAEKELQSLPADAGPLLEWFRQWRDSGSAPAPFRAAAWLLVGRGPAALALAAQQKVPLVQALCATDEPAARRAFLEALTAGADMSLFELQPPPPPIAVRRPVPAGKAEETPPPGDGRSALRAALLQRLADKAQPASLLPALRALALLGEDMPALLAEPACRPFQAEPLSQRYVDEVCGGVR